MSTCSSLSNIQTSIKVFERLARRNGIRYAVKKDKNTQPPTYYIFFKGKSAEVIEATLKEFTKAKLDRSGRHPIHDRLKKYGERAKETALNLAKDRNKQKVR